MMIDKDRREKEGGLIINDLEREALVLENSEMSKYIRKLYGGEEFINGRYRWCLWMVDAPPELLRGSERLRRRFENIKKFRLSSDRDATRRLASTPFLFGEIRQPKSRYLIVPKVSSEARTYLPMGFLPPEVIASGSALVLPGAEDYHFGVLQSSMHMAWMRCVSGRMKSDYQYSAAITYNNYPWPVQATEAQRGKVSALAEGVLAARQGYLDRGSTLADLYDPLSMPADLLKAHQALDKAVDQCYRKAPFASDRERVEHLFRLYEELTAPLAMPDAPKAKRKPRARRTPG